MSVRYNIVDTKTGEHIYDLSPTEVSQFLGIPKQTVWMYVDTNRKFFGRYKIRKFIADEISLGDKLWREWFCAEWHEMQKLFGIETEGVKKRGTKSG